MTKAPAVTQHKQPGKCPTPFSCLCLDDAVLKFQEEFEAECKRIVTEIQDKFIDLNIEDDESGYGQDEMQMKQERFQKDMENVEVFFSSNLLDLPDANTTGGSEASEIALEYVDKLQTQD